MKSLRAIEHEICPNEGGGEERKEGWIEDEIFSQIRSFEYFLDKWTNKICWWLWDWNDGWLFSKFDVSSIFVSWFSDGIISFSDIDDVWRFIVE